MDEPLFGFKDNAVPDGDLNGKFKHSWVEDSFDFEGSVGVQPEISKTRSYIGSSISGKKISILAGLIIVGLAIILVRDIQIQIFKGNYFRGLAEGNRVRIQPIVSERGVIFDSNGRALVQNVPNFSLAIVPQDLPRDPADKQKVVDKIVELSGVPHENIDSLLTKYGSYSYASLVIKENLDYESALKMYIQSSLLPGVLIEKGSKRKYLINTDLNTSSSTLSMSHLLGYLGKVTEQDLAADEKNVYLLFDNIGKSGLEKFYETGLRGIYGKKKVEVDALGHEQNVLAEEAPVPGKNLILSIDMEAQAKMEDLIKNAVKNYGKKRAAGIAMDPKTGAILALVSWPAFNNNDFSGGISQEEYKKYTSDEDKPLFNRAIGGTYPSGSTVKMIVASAALQEKIITANTTVNSTGGIKVDRWFFKDWSAGGHGITNVYKALAWSVNTFFYYIGGGYKDFVGLGASRLTAYMRSFGLAAKTGIDIPGEAAGFIPSKEWKQNVKGESWYVGDTYNLSIGQGDLLVTPLQVALWTATIANGGKIVQPHIVEKLDNPGSDKKDAIPLKTTNVPVSANNISIVRQGMRDCVTVGSCQMLNSLPFTTGAKTGTAQWSNSKDNHAWFTSFAPANNPQIVVTVIIEEGEEGSRTAEPVARDFLAWWGEKYLR